MAIRKISFAEDEYYHLYNRGNSKQIIFQENEDYFHFIKLLYISNQQKNFAIRNLSKNIFQTKITEKLVEISSYCLMPNHFHVLVKQTENGSISKFMQKVSTAYSMYYNKKYKRTGGLFEGRFRSQHVSSDKYLKYLFSYINLNPLKLIDKNWKEKGIRNKREALEFLQNYIYSSYCDYLGSNRPQSVILDRNLFMNYFITPGHFKKEILDWMNFKPTT